MFCGLRGTPRRWRDALPDVLWHDRDLVRGIVELLRSAALKPKHSSRRIWRRDRIDVRDQRGDRGAERRVGDALEGEANIVRANRLPVMPLRARVDMESNAERVRAPLPAIREV